MIHETLSNVFKFLLLLLLKEEKKTTSLCSLNRRYFPRLNVHPIIRFICGEKFIEKEN